MSLLSKIIRSSPKGLRLSQMIRRKTYRKPSKPWKDTAKVKEHSRRLWWMNAGILATVFASCYLMVPFYRMFCEATGLVGDMEQKNYTEVRNRTDKRNPI